MLSYRKLFNHGDNCHNRSEELVHTPPTITGNRSSVNVEMSLVDHSNTDDHFDGK